MDREDDNFSYGEIYGIQLGRPRGKLPLTVKIILAVVAFIVVIACIGSSTFMPTVAVTLQDASRALAKMGINVTRLADVVSESADVFNPDNVDTVLPADFYTTYNIDKTKLSLERVRAMEAAYIMCTYDDGAADRGASGILLYSQGGYDADDDYGSSLDGDVVYASGTVLSRIKDWTTAFNYYTAKKTFGADCSSLMSICMDYVDMKTGSSYHSVINGDGTSTLLGKAEFKSIDFNDLAPGDVLLKDGHTLMFFGWSDRSSKTAFVAEASTQPSSTSDADNMARSVRITEKSISNMTHYFHGMEIGGYTPSNSPVASGQQFELIDTGSEKYVRFYIPSNLTYQQLGGYSTEFKEERDVANYQFCTYTYSWLKDRLNWQVGDSVNVQGGLSASGRLSGLGSYVSKDSNGIDCLNVNGEVYYVASISQGYFMDNTTINTFLGADFHDQNVGYIYRVNMTDGTSFNFVIKDAIGIDHSCTNGGWSNTSGSSWKDPKTGIMYDSQDAVKYKCEPMSDPKYEKLYHAATLHILEAFTSDGTAFANYITANRSRHIQSIDLTNITIQSLISGGTT